MTQYAYRQGSAWIEITGQWASMTGDHPAGWVDTATPEELQAAGAFAITNGRLVPFAYEIKLGEELVDADNLPVRQGIFAEMTLEQRKAVMGAELRIIWLEHELGGFMGPAGPVATDETVQRRLLTAIAAFDHDHTAGPWAWEVRANDIVLVTEGGLHEIARTIFAHIEDCADHARDLLQAIVEAPDHAALTDLDLDGGWPL